MCLCCLLAFFCLKCKSTLVLLQSASPESRKPPENSARVSQLLWPKTDADDATQCRFSFLSFARCLSFHCVLVTSVEVFDRGGCPDPARGKLCAHIIFPNTKNPDPKRGEA